MAGCARPNARQNGEDGEDREEHPAVGRIREEACEHGRRRGDEGGEEEGVVEPAERLRVNYAELDEDAQGEIQDKQDGGGEEDQSSLGPSPTPP